MSSRFRDDAEWLEADGRGGFASGTVSGRRTRRYHALLLTATTPPTGRVVLVNGFDAHVETSAGSFALASQYYAPGVIHPDGASRMASFEPEPWPTWGFELSEGIRIEQTLFVPKGSSLTVLRWHVSAQSGDVALVVRPFLSGRDYHALHHENPDFRFDAEVAGERVTWRPYSGLPAISAVSNGAYSHQPDWYRNFLYEAERERGLDCNEDLAAPGTFRWDLSRADAVLMLAAAGHTDEMSGAALDCADRLRAAEAKRRRFPSRLHRAADAYVVAREKGKTIIAGYPWFTDWGRDTFIALRGICLATGRFDDAREILLQWAGCVSEGMLPNRFPDAGSEAEFNAVDASLWYIIAVHDFLQAAGAKVSARDRTRLAAAVSKILEGYTKGTRFGIRLDSDGLLCAGAAGVQLTWMDAKVGDWVVTPRGGKPVEVQALWLNALRIGATLCPAVKWRQHYDRGVRELTKRFWNEDAGYLADVVDPDGRSGAVDLTFRPNQILAVGGLPYVLLERGRARRVVQAVEQRLWTPMGLRSLAPEEPQYCGRYTGGVRERDGAYHQGTVWPWLLGPFVQAWLRVRGETESAKRTARVRFLEPLLAHLDDAGIGHIPEVADGDAPHRPGGCPFQAWSVGEALRVKQMLTEACAPRRETPPTHGRNRRAVR